MKKILRKKLINKRKKKYTELSQKHISNIFELIKKKYSNIKIIGGYIPINYEFNCTNLLKYLELKKYTICLPIIKNNFQMDFYKYSFKEPLKINKLGIPEPINSLNRVIPDLIFVPLVGYDKTLIDLDTVVVFMIDILKKFSIKKNNQNWTCLFFSEN